MSPRRLRRDREPVRVYYGFNAVATFCYTLTFTVNLLYMAVVVGLSPLQMVLVGTVLEITCFVFEIPTGIVADLHSRRTSVILGFVLIGIGFLVQTGPSFAAVLVAQVIWGVGATFTSGAAQAWITDEVGADAVGRVFVRTTQIDLVAGIAGTVVAGLLSLWFLSLPMLVSGFGLLGLAVWLALVMPERHFAPVPVEDRDTFGQMAQTARDGWRLARSRRTVMGLLVISGFVGLASEAFDRLWTVRIVQDFPLPPLLGADNPGAWFAAVALVGSVVALGLSLLVGRLRARRPSTVPPARFLAGCAAVQVLCVVGVAVAGTLGVALAALWAKGAAQAVAAPVEAAWLNGELRSDVRATVLSMNAQVNAIGQVGGGPPLGAFAGRTSVPVALLAAAALLTPTVGIFGWLSRDKAPADSTFAPLAKEA